MPDQPFTAYMVAALFGAPPTGKIMLNAVCAPSPEAASAIAVWAFTKELNSDEPLNGINVSPLTAEFMRAALAGKPADVLPFSVARGPLPAPQDCTCSPVWSEADGGFTHQPWCLKAQHAPRGDGDAA
jgi:hypothetical protein